MVFKLAVFGGTFDPIHLGHIKVAQALQHSFHFDALHFLPCKMPVLKDAAQATPIQRISMLELAIKDYPDFIIDTREITRETPSYMVETLDSLRQQYGHEASINLILGSDAFRQLPYWYQFNDIKNLANCIVLQRAELNPPPLSPELLNFIKSTKSVKSHEVFEHSKGLIINFDAGQYFISSTKVRQKLALGEDVSQLLSPAVIDYIKDQQLYGLEYFH